MGVDTNFFIKVNSNEYYDQNGTFKSINEINTQNGESIIKTENLAPLRHTMLSAIDDTCNVFNQITSSNGSYFYNEDFEQGIISLETVQDTLADAVDPLCSNKLFKGGIDYPVMHPKMVATLDYLSRYIPTDVSTTSSAEIIPNSPDNRTVEEIPDEDSAYKVPYSVNCYGVIPDGKYVPSGLLPGCGIIEFCAGGGGSGGTNNEDEDCAGSGGGGGGYACIYYRIKTETPVDVRVANGAGGTRGPSSSGQAGSGGNSGVYFIANGVTYRILAYGGTGGEAGNENMTEGGYGGKVQYDVGDGTWVQAVAGGGRGSDNGSPTQGGNLASPIKIVDNEYLIVVLLAAIGGGGGGSGDDTGSSQNGQAGAGTPSKTQSLPYVFGTSKSLKVGGYSGGSRGASVSQARSGGGGASALGKGGNGGGESHNGYQGGIGAGAGGAGAGDNANRVGKAGSAGIVRLFV